MKNRYLINWHLFYLLTRNNGSLSVWKFLFNRYSGGFGLRHFSSMISFHFKRQVFYSAELPAKIFQKTPTLYSGTSFGVRSPAVNLNFGLLTNLEMQCFNSLDVNKFYYIYIHVDCFAVLFQFVKCHCCNFHSYRSTITPNGTISQRSNNKRFFACVDRWTFKNLAWSFGHCLRYTDMYTRVNYLKGLYSKIRAKSCIFLQKGRF